MSFPTDLMEMEEVQGPPRLPDFQGHFHAHEGEAGRLDVADARDAVEVEEFSTEYEAFGRAREPLENGDHGGASARDSSGNVLCEVRLQLKLATTRGPNRRWVPI